MPYQDFADAFEAIRDPITSISGLYDQARVAIDAAATIGGDGSPTIDFGALDAALDILPPGNEERLKRVTQGLDRGFAMIGKQPQPLAPWWAFQDAQALRPFDQGFWTALGFIGPKARPFRGIEKVPDEVVAPDNMAMLNELAQSALSYENLEPSALVVANASPSIWRLEPRNNAMIAILPPDDTSSNVGTSKQALKPEDFTGSIDCLAHASYRFVGFGFVLEICMSRACADALENLLSLGSGTLLAAGVGLLTKGAFTAAAVGSAVSAVGGWIAFFILVSAAYWAIMIHLNKTSNGVCLYIPMPWTFGVIGPGWAIGR